MASIQSLLDPTSESYEYPSEQNTAKSESPKYNPEGIKDEAERESVFVNLDLKAFQRVTRKTHMGFGTRVFPPRIDSAKAELFHLKRNGASGRGKQKIAALESFRTYPKPYKFSSDQKMRGYIVDREFRSRKWNCEDMKIPTVGGKTLVLPTYTPNPPSKRYAPYRELPGLEPKYFVSTITKPIIAQPSPMLPLPMPSIPLRAPINNNLLPVPHSKSSKERMNCPVPNCNKDFADRSSLNRHKKRMHPEITNSRTNLMQT